MSVASDLTVLQSRPLHAVALPGDRATVCGLRFGSATGGGKDAGLPYCWRRARAKYLSAVQAGRPVCARCWS